MPSNNAVLIELPNATQLPQEQLSLHLLIGETEFGSRPHNAWLKYLAVCVMWTPTTGTCTDLNSETARCRTNHLSPPACMNRQPPSTYRRQKSLHTSLQSIPLFGHLPYCTVAQLFYWANQFLFKHLRHAFTFSSIMILGTFSASDNTRMI